MAEGEEIWPMWFLTNELTDSSHKTFVDTFWFAWLYACVKPNWPKGEVQQVHQLINWFRPENTLKAKDQDVSCLQLHI